MNLPTAEQSIKCVILCQSLTNKFTIPVFICLDERTGNLFIRSGDKIEMEIDRDGSLLDKN